MSSSSDESYIPSPMEDEYFMMNILIYSLNKDEVGIEETCEECELLHENSYRLYKDNKDFTKALGLTGYLDEIPCVRPDDYRESIDRDMTKYILSIYPYLIDYVPETKDPEYIVAKLIRGDRIASRNKIIMGEDQEFVIFRHIMYLYSSRNIAQINNILIGIFGESMDGSGIINKEDKDEWRRMLLEFTIFLMMIKGPQTKSNIWKEFGINTKPDMILGGTHDKFVNTLRKYSMIPNNLLNNINLIKKEKNRFVVSAALLSAAEVSWADEYRKEHKNGENFIDILSEEYIATNISDAWFYCSQYRGYKTEYILPKSITEFVEEVHEKNERNPPTGNIEWRRSGSSSSYEGYRNILYNAFAYPRIYEYVINNSIPNICGNISILYLEFFEYSPAKLIRASRLVYDITNKPFFDKYMKEEGKKYTRGITKVATLPLKYLDDTYEP
jgi:hypothetical protein